MTNNTNRGGGRGFQLLLALLLGAILLAAASCGTADAIGRAAAAGGKAVIEAGRCTLHRSIKLCGPVCRACVGEQATRCVLGLPEQPFVPPPPPASQPVKP